MNKRLSLILADVCIFGLTIFLLAEVATSQSRKRLPPPEPLTPEFAAADPVRASPPTPPAPAPVLKRHPGACTESFDFRTPEHMGTDGVADSVIKRSFDSEGRPVEESWWRSDAPDRTVEFHYDDAGRLDRQTVRLTKGDEVETTTYKYDRAGHQILEAIDETHDGVPDWLTEKDYDPSGKLIAMRENIKATTHKVGLNHWYQYDAKGRLELEKVDNDGDGKVDFQIQYRYDERDLLIEKHSHWLMVNGPVDEVFTYTYDDQKRLITETHDGFFWSYHYDSAGNLLFKDYRPPVRPGVDQSVMERVDYGYDCW